MKKRKPFWSHEPPNIKVRIIRDVRDASLDYYIDSSAATRLYNAGKLFLVQVHGDRWDYHEKEH